MDIKKCDVCEVVDMCPDCQRRFDSVILEFIDMRMV